MKVKAKENFGLGREVEFEANNWDGAYLKAMHLFNEKNKSRIMDEYYYTFRII